MSIGMMDSEGNSVDRGEVVTETGSRLRVQLDCSQDGHGRTKQEFKDECDVNQIVEKNSPKLRGDGSDLVYGDFANADDYLSAMNALKAAQAGFGRLPARVRDAMENSPAKLLEFVADEKNRERAEELGLVMRRDMPTHIAVTEGEIPPGVIENPPAGEAPTAE